MTNCHVMQKQNLLCRSNWHRQTEMGLMFGMVFSPSALVYRSARKRQQAFFDARWRLLTTELATCC